MKFKCVNDSNNNINIEISEFSRQKGTAEYHIVLTPVFNGTIEEQLSAIARAYYSLLIDENIDKETIVFKKFFVSDLINQMKILENNPFSSGSSKNILCCISYIGQPPLPDNKVCLWVYHVAGKKNSRQIKENMVTDLILKRNGYKHIWSAGISVQEALPASDQTKHVFSSYNRCLEELNLKLKNNVLRTWLYVQNIDTNYSDVVKARKDFFNVNGLTRDTHYITSTGIEGKYTDPNVKVFMDAYAVDGITEEQIRFLKAPAFLNPTHEYGVTFERGVSVEYGDRKHIFIAGTASINNKGEILYENEILLQLGRIKENIIALLDEAGAGLQDIAHLIAYVRDIADYPVVKNYIEENFGPVPKIIVLAAICRPGWLTEIECIAIKNAENLILNNF